MTTAPLNCTFKTVWRKKFAVVNDSRKRVFGIPWFQFCFHRVSTYSNLFHSSEFQGKCFRELIYESIWIFFWKICFDLKNEPWGNSVHRCSTFPIALQLQSRNEKEDNNDAIRRALRAISLGLSTRAADREFALIASQSLSTKHSWKRWQRYWHYVAQQKIWPMWLQHWNHYHKHHYGKKRQHEVKSHTEYLF